MSLLLAIVLHSFFSVELVQMLVVDTVGNRNHPLVELVVANLASTDEQDRRPARIEGVENSIRVAASLNPELPHVSMLRATHIRAVWERQCRTSCFQEVDDPVDSVLH